MQLLQGQKKRVEINLHQSDYEDMHCFPIASMKGVAEGQKIY